MIRLLLPLPEEKKRKLALLELDQASLDKLKSLYKLDHISIKPGSLQMPLVQKISYPIIQTREKELEKFASSVNKRLLYRTKEEAFSVMAKAAEELLLQYLGSEIVGFEDAKHAVLYQLFAVDPVHILLLGDPGTGKTRILLAAEKLHTKSSFGLGSGTSSAGLGASKKGNKLIMGLLPRADNGICCIDELNLMKKSDYAYLYSAMEKGYITYTKSDVHEKISTRVRVLATANPKGDAFAGTSPEAIRKQLPFEQALLSRFHLVFFLHKADEEQLLKITSRMLNEQEKTVPEKELALIRDYVDYAWKKEVTFPRDFEKEMLDMVKQMKASSRVLEIGPRTIMGFMRLCKARARMHLRDSVGEQDIEAVKGLFKVSKPSGDQGIKVPIESRKSIFSNLSQ